MRHVADLRARRRPDEERVPEARRVPWPAGSGRRANLGSVIASTTTASIEPATDADLLTVQRLAGVIWRRHYPGIITDAQIDYMLERGYAPEALGKFLGGAGSGLALGKVDGETVAFAAWCPPGESATLKLDKLYVLQEHQGGGLGRALIEHVAACGRATGCTRLILCVNKRNTGSIRAYERCGFAIREAVVVDIGNGFVMDDYVMARDL